MAATIFQHEIVTSFVLPFLLMFFIVFALLEKTKVLGGDKKQISALVAFVIGLIFISAFTPKMVVEDIILFLAVALVIVFAGLLLFSFGIGGDGKIDEKWFKGVFGVIIAIGLLVTVLWSAGVLDNVWNFLFDNSWSSEFWINALFIIVIAGALAIAIGSKAKSD
jgi:hypothetical protein